MSRKHRSACLAAVLAASLVSAGCSDRSAGGLPKDGAPAADKDAPKVTAVHPEKKSLSRGVEQPGTIRPFEETQLFARVPGYVGKVGADIGQKVKAGDVLAELAVPEMEQEGKQKQALVKQAEAEAEQSRRAQASSEANVAAVEAMAVEVRAGVSRAEALLARWESEAKRVTRLVSNGTLDAQTADETQNQFRAAAASRDEAKARVLSAEAAVRKAKADLGKARADVLAAESRVDVAKAEAGRLAALLAYATIRAPYDGVVTRRRVNTGDFVQPAAGKPEGLFTVARVDPVRVVIAVPEADASLVQDKSPVQLTIAALDAPALSGHVTRTSWSLEPGTRTLRAEVDMDNADGRLRPGMYVHARILAKLPERWTLPAAALTKQGDTTVCFQIEGTRVVSVPVLAGRTDGKFTEVLKRRAPGADGSWEEWTGKESVAERAAGLTDGRTIQLGGAAK